MGKMELFGEEASSTGPICVFLSVFVVVDAVLVDSRSLILETKLAITGQFEEDLEVLFEDPEKP